MVGAYSESGSTNLLIADCQRCAGALGEWALIPEPLSDPNFRDRITLPPFSTAA